MGTTNQEMDTEKNFEDRLNDLEMKLAFQEDLLNTLNDVIANQDREIQDLWSANRLLKQSLGDIKAGSTTSEQEPPPPHY